MNFLPPFHSRATKKLFHKKAIKLSAEKPQDLKLTAQIIKNGGIVAFPFNGIYGLFGDIDNKKAEAKIYQAKNRPKDKKLILVVAPELLTEFAEFDHLNIPHQNLVSFWKEIHALGIILPSKNSVPVTLDNSGTILTIWTEYQPLRSILDEFRKLGGKAFIATSANKSGQPTHFAPDTLWKDFEYDVDAIIEADFSHLSDLRKKSTTVVDMTTNIPKLHRIGNVLKSEIDELIKKYKIPKLAEDEPLIVVQSRIK